MEARTLAHGRRGDCGFDRCSILAAVMAMVAKLVPRSRVVGLDLWTDDQSGNRPEATLRNLEAEGVSDRCELKTGDMLSIPFPDDRFDLIVSSMAIHKIDENKVLDHTRRLQALDEVMRVLRTDGRLVVADFWTGACANYLHQRGLIDVQQQSLGWHFWRSCILPVKHHRR